MSLKKKDTQQVVNSGLYFAQAQSLHIPGGGEEMDLYK